MYIDDRAINPYQNSISLMGYLNENEEQTPINMLPTNKYNSICVVDNMICKTGPYKYLSGEIYYYKNIPTQSQITECFPSFYKAVDNKLYIENIKGIPFYKLYKAELITKQHINRLFEIVNSLHNVYGEKPSTEDVIANYGDKLRARFKVKEDYPFEDAEEVQVTCLKLIDAYIPSSVAFIHGDLWFSNILIEMNGGIKLIDMKGQLNNKYTTGGDALYDYGKLYQSILGFDAILYNDHIDEYYSKYIRKIFEDELYKRNIDIKVLKNVTFSLVIGTFHSIEVYATKKRLWNWIKETFYLDSMSV